MLTDKAKEIKKRLLDAERDREVVKARERLAKNNLLGSGIEGQVIVPILKRYENLKALIDEENISPTINRGKIPLFENSSRYEELYRLERLFAEVDFATYPKVARSINIIKKEDKFISANKKHILIIKKTFNKRSKSTWGYKLKAVRKPLEGLKLVPTKQTPFSS